MTTTTDSHPVIAPPRGVDIWCVSLEQPPAAQVRLAAQCSSSEHERAARMPIAARRRDFLVARGILRSILGAYLGTAPERVRIARSAHGKPFIDEPGAPAFNISHSHVLAVIAVSAGFAVGVDLERVDPLLDVAAIQRWFLSPKEGAHLVAVPPDARTHAFLRLWTRKEAVAKANGGGIAAGFAIAVPLTGGAAPTFDGVRTIVDLDPAPGYVAALAYDAPPATLRTPDHALAHL
jgi:4'-phosphopantetheinyl transferase